MTQNEFIAQLESVLISKGLDKQQAEQKCQTVTNNLNKLSDEDASKYYTESNVELFAERILNESNGDQSKPTLVISKTESLNTVSNENSQKTVVTDNTDVVFHTSTDQSNNKNKSKSVNADITNKYTDNSKIVWILLALCLPVIVLLVALILGISLAIALAMAGVIIVIICLITGIVCGGSALAILSLIYGITQIISEPRYVGLHEIGLAFIFAGITMLICIVLYNIAVRFIPALYKIIGLGLKKLFEKSKKWFELAKKGCKNL